MDKNQHSNTPTQRLNDWKLTTAQLATVNKRSNDLGGEQSWIPQSMNLITKTFKLKAVDFMRISKGAMTYVFENVFSGRTKENIKQAFESFNETLRLVLTTHYNADGKPLTHMLKRMVASLTEQVAQTLSLLEMTAPLTFCDRLLHILLHVPMSMAKWNACRNFWTFPSERYTH
jgi:hypothetical protein